MADHRESSAGTAHRPIRRGPATRTAVACDGPFYGGPSCDGPTCDDAPLPRARPVRGRAALTNRSGRYERDRREAVDDGWGTLAAEYDAPPRIRTTVTADSPRSIIARNDSPDVPFDRSVNPYRGCEHGCVYCFARPSHAYLGLSPGLDFETQLWVKREAPALLDRALRRPGYSVQPMALGTNTDCYQPLERDERITRGVLEVLAAFQHPVSVITKSALVTRDVDLLGGMAARGLAEVCISVTTLDSGLARAMEPRAATPARRLQAIRTLSEAGIPVAVLASPMIPGLNDHELEAILDAAARAGATGASTLLLRLPLELTDLFEEWLRHNRPDRADRILSLIRQCRGGALYDSRFGTRMKGEGSYAQMLHSRFKIACNRLGLTRERWANLDCSRFRVPPKPGDQLALL